MSFRIAIKGRSEAVVAGMGETILAMSRGRLGIAVVTGDDASVQGLFTDGDLRRAFGEQLDFKKVRIADLMNRNPYTIGPDRLAVEAVEMMERHRINALLVIASDGKLIGALNMHDLFKAKVI